MRRPLWFIGSLLITVPALAELPGFATQAAEELAARAVVYQLKVLTTHGAETVFGPGVWMGHGRALTASHLFAQYEAGDSIRVALRSRIYVTTLLARGRREDGCGASLVKSAT